MDYNNLIIPGLVLLLILILIIVFQLKKKSVIRKVSSLSDSEKDALLDTLAEPVGYLYEPYQDIFVSRLDAIQKNFGYATLYNHFAPYFNMVFDHETFYFDYDNRTWRIEIWKGQYGINVGCELGIYYADGIISPDKYDSTLFTAVPEKDMLDISLKLNLHCTKRYCPYSKLGYVSEKHWWLTIFNMGIFSVPSELFVNISITFKNYKMMHAFLDSFTRTLPDTPYKTVGLTVYFTFFKSARRYSFFKKTVRHIALFLCKIYCKLFNHMTKPFTKRYFFWQCP